MTGLATLEERVANVDYSKLKQGYVPTNFALDFITFIKLVNDGRGDENKSPVIHYDMLDTVNKHNEDLFISFRGSAKTSAMHEYMFLYMAVYGGIPGFGEVDVAIYISDTIDNGVKSMRQQLEFRYSNSDFLKKYIPYTRFTDVRWEFRNLEGKSLCIRGFGASTGIRGFKEYGKRPTWLGLDDLMSDKNADSPTIIRDIKNIIYKAARQAMHSSKRKIIWTGTPFNSKDPLYLAANSAAWTTKVYPICERFPCTKEEFIGAWEDRFPYEFVKQEYEFLLTNGEVASFNQELMLRIMSDEDRLIQDCDINWYKLDSVLKNIDSFNFYITTDFATSKNTSSDFSVICVWAYNSNGDWFWVDGVCERQLMDKNVDDLFRLAQKYKPQSVGIEVSGQQGGFIPWIQNEMITRNIYFTLASENNKNVAGIRPTTDKMGRFTVVVPLFKAGKMFFPDERRRTSILVEAMSELTLASVSKFKSKHDDFIDTISMLALLKTWKPSQEIPITKRESLWELDTPIDTSYIDSYIV